MALYQHILKDTWRERAERGPYKSQGDAGQKYTPADWERVVTNKNKFVLKPDDVLWTGVPGAGLVTINNAGKQGYDVPDKTKIGYMLDAAFYAFVMDDEGLKVKVKDVLLKFAAQPRLNFANRKVWPLYSLGDQSPIFEMGIFCCMLYYAYKLAETGFTEKDKAVMMSFFTPLAHYLKDNVNNSMDQVFEKRGIPLEDYKYKGDTTITESTHEGGYPLNTLPKRKNNRQGHMSQGAALIGIEISDQSLTDCGVNFVKETLAFACYSDGVFAELHRSILGLPSKGLGYMCNTLGSCIAIAAALHEAGDSSLYDFKTKAGMFGTQGNVEKSLLWAIKQHGTYLTGEKKIYSKEGKIGDEAFRIDGTHANWNLMHDVSQFCVANLYYDDLFVKEVYTRTARGIYPYPASGLSTNGTENAFDGLVGYPAGLFMFGQLEHKFRKKVYSESDMEAELKRRMEGMVTPEQHLRAMEDKKQAYKGAEVIRWDVAKDNIVSVIEAARQQAVNME